MTEQVQCICKPKCKCAANPNYVWVTNLKSRKTELKNKRKEKMELRSKQNLKDFASFVMKSVENAVSSEVVEINMSSWYVHPEMIQLLRDEYFIGLQQVGESCRYKFTFLV